MTQTSYKRIVFAFNKIDKYLDFIGIFVKT